MPQPGGVRSFAARHKLVTGKRRIGPGAIVAAITVLTCLLIVVVWSHFFVQLSSPPSSATATELPPPGNPVEKVDIVQRLRNDNSLDLDKINVQKSGLYLYKKPGCSGEPFHVITPSEDHDEDKLNSLCELEIDQHDIASMKLEGNIPEVDFYSSCHRDNYYVGSVFKSEGCVGHYNYPTSKSFKFKFTSSLAMPQTTRAELDLQFSLQDHKPNKAAGEPAKTRIVFSCESAEYFGYQVWANYYGYLTSGQKSASWTRLLTAGERDDLPEVTKGLVTFQAKRTLYSRRYSPINKPDVITKWFESPDRPEEEVIAVIDPDNWLLKDVSKYSDQVSPGQAVGEPAYYFGSRTAQRLWKAVCEKNCDSDVDLVGVPYFVHRDDLRVIAPLWRHYTIMLKDRANTDKEFEKKYGHLDLAWAAEMFGYNFASAHAGVKHKVVRRIQVRDVDGEHRKERLQEVSMLHVGRAWFPKDYAPAQKWAHTEGKSFSHFGKQVWCKCNFTASSVLPWPVPPEADFQSTHTLEIMHYANERFGKIPENLKYRKGPTRSGYSRSVD